MQSWYWRSRALSLYSFKLWRLADLELQLELSDTLQSWGYSVTTLDNFLLVLFEKYAELLQERFSDDFHEVCIPCYWYKYIINLEQIVSTDDYMPMPIATLDEYEKVINVSWYTPEKTTAELT